MNIVRNHLLHIGDFRGMLVLLPVLLIPALHSVPLAAQDPPRPSADVSLAPQTAAQPPAELDRRLGEITAALEETQRSLAQSVREIQRLQSELAAVRSQITAPGTQPPVNRPSDTQPERATVDASASSSSSGPASTTNLQRVAENQEAIQAEVKQHDQTKVETVSKYPLRFGGLVLFNAFANSGSVDNTNLPTVASPRFPNTTHGTLGGTMRQTLLSLTASGPRLAGARSSAELSMDFFGGISYSYYGSPASSLRLRRASINLDWSRTTVQAGLLEPLISPLSPTSFATVAQPALSWAGNLWTWAPQLRIEHRLPLPGSRAVHLEFGLLDPQPTDLATTRALPAITPTESQRRPAVEGRVSYHASPFHRSEDLPLVLGLSAYSGEQRYDGSIRVHSWATTADWKIPFNHHLELSGEVYRGRALGGLGGGAYKDVLSGTDPRTHLPRIDGVDAIGGWSQLKARLAPTLEANAAFGLDDALAGNFRRIQLSASNDPLQFYARNTMVVGNVIFRPRTYLILSPEYRRIVSWRITGPSASANVYTLSAGYQF